MKTSSHPAIRFFVLTVAVSCLAGCGKNVSEVSGKITYLEQPLNYGFVIFVDEDNQSVQTKINPDGSYTVSGVPYGLVKVAVTSPDPSKLLQAGKLKAAGGGQANKFKKDLPERTLPPGVELEKWFEIPNKYRDYSASGISVMISSPTTQFDISLDDN
jgi:hypothetical protein